MKNTKRKKIMIEVNKRMNEAFEDYTDIESGLFEKEQDNYIETVCKENGFTLSDFYATDGKTLKYLIR